MSKLKNILAGTRAIKKVSLPLQNATNADGSPKVVEVGLRCLIGDEVAEVYKRAASFSLTLGCNKLDEADSRWTLALQVYTIAVAAVDSECSPTAPEPFFQPEEGSSLDDRVRYIMSSPLIGRDTIAYLYEQQDLWQDECNPRKRQVTPEEISQIVKEAIATESYTPFLRLAPVARLNCLLFMGVQWWSSQLDKSSSGQSSSPPTRDTATETESPVQSSNPPTRGTAAETNAPVVT